MRPHWPTGVAASSFEWLCPHPSYTALASLGIVSALMILQGSLANSMQASSHQIDTAAERPAGEPTGAARPGTGGEADGAK